MTINPTHHAGSSQELGGPLYIHLGSKDDNLATNSQQLAEHMLLLHTQTCVTYISRCKITCKFTIPTQTLREESGDGSSGEETFKHDAAGMIQGFPSQFANLTTILGLTCRRCRNTSNKAMSRVKVKGVPGIRRFNFTTCRWCAQYELQLLWSWAAGVGASLA